MGGLHRFAIKRSRLGGAGRHYEVEHADLSDKRGIDVSFLYDPTWLTVSGNETFHHVVMRRTGTREPSNVRE